MGIIRQLPKADLYSSLDICGVEISVQLKAQSYGMLSGTLTNAKNRLENWMFNNYMLSLLTFEDTCEPAIQPKKNKWATIISTGYF